ncbi:MAG: hypothetical protein KDK40_03475, partial [Chlamydiia bacterium]|nr:hypothetical protein [Chlamydiia bacterium]
NPEKFLSVVWVEIIQRFEIASDRKWSGDENYIYGLGLLGGRYSPKHYSAEDVMPLQISGTCAMRSFEPWILKLLGQKQGRRLLLDLYLKGTIDYFHSRSDKFESHEVARRLMTSGFEETVR